MIVTVLLSLVLAFDDPPVKFRVVAPKPHGLSIVALNSKGDTIGFEWKEEEDPDKEGIVDQKPFFASGETFTYLPLLEGFTSTFVHGVSDDGVVVGRVSKPAPLGVRVMLRNQAFVWTAKDGIRGLGVASGDNASYATDISRDGRRISGITIGEGRMRACVWDREGDTWKPTPLDHQGMIGGHTIAISDDGLTVAANDDGRPCLWTRQDGGAWKREVIATPEPFAVRAVNNAGTIAGVVSRGDAATHAVVWTRAKGYQMVKEPEGYARSEAFAVNNLGDVVGMVDGPHGSEEVGPRAFVIQDGVLRLIDEAGPAFATAAAVNDARQVAGIIEGDKEPEAPKPSK